jgi:hypothetical protein
MIPAGRRTTGFSKSLANPEKPATLIKTEKNRDHSRQHVRLAPFEFRGRGISDTSSGGFL